MPRAKPLPEGAPTEPIWYLRGCPYTEYRQSKWWRKRRFQYMDKMEADYGRKLCELCGLEGFEDPEVTVKFSVHHLNYDHLGYERDKDLLLVCGPCHNLIHFPETGQAKHWAKFNEDNDLAELAAAVCPDTLSPAAAVE